MQTTRNEIGELLPDAKIIRLRGYTKKNKDYQKAKAAIEKWQDVPDLTDQEIDSWLQAGGWIGAVVPENRLIIDIDDRQAGLIVENILLEYGLSWHEIKTPNGFQFIFNGQTEEEIRQIAKFYTSIGIKVDTRTALKGYIVWPTETTDQRYVLKKSEETLSSVPRWLIPIKKVTNQNIEFPIQDEGSRNDTLYRFASCLRSWRVSAEDITESMQIVYDHLLLDKSDFPFSELRSIVSSALKWQLGEREDYSITVERRPTFIPPPFQVKQGQLFKITIKRVGGVEYEDEKRVSMITPFVLKKLSDIERNHVFYEIAWKEEGRDKSQVVAASTLARRQGILGLSDLGLSVNELNFKDMIHYFDLFIGLNDLERCSMAERLGWIGDRFVNPYNSGDLIVAPPGISEQQTLKAFRTKENLESWQREVYDKIKIHPKIVFLIFASLASVILKDLGVTPFIVDLSGSTSQGKTTALRVAASVWGDEGLLGEWNITRVSVERKAAFLNNFPLFLDDTRKAEEKILQSVIYQFSGGRAKGRGALIGGQEEATWNNILISTGEVSLSEFSGGAAGASARVISLTDEPFGKVSPEHFKTIYKAIEGNYGSLGASFLQEWGKKKDQLMPEFRKVQEFYIDKSQENEVVTRMSRYFAAIHFTAAAAKELLGLEVDFRIFEHIFNDVINNTLSLNKPKELLGEILSDLDRCKHDIYYNDSLFQGPPKILKAIYHNEKLFLHPAYVKEKLGIDNRLIRKEWVKKGYIIPKDKKEETQVVKKCGKTFRGLEVSPEILNELNYYFGEDEAIIPFKKAKK